jgi:hypothetical protein
MRRATMKVLTFKNATRHEKIVDITDFLECLTETELVMMEYKMNEIPSLRVHIEITEKDNEAGRQDIK